MPIARSKLALIVAFSFLIFTSAAAAGTDLGGSVEVQVQGFEASAALTIEAAVSERLARRAFDGERDAPDRVAKTSVRVLRNESGSVSVHIAQESPTLRTVVRELALLEPRLLIDAVSFVVSETLAAWRDDDLAVAREAEIAPQQAAPRSARDDTDRSGEASRLAAKPLSSGVLVSRSITRKPFRRLWLAGGYELALTAGSGLVEHRIPLDLDVQWTRMWGVRLGGAIPVTSLESSTAKVELRVRRAPLRLGPTFTLRTRRVSFLFSLRATATIVRESIDAKTASFEPRAEKTQIEWGLAPRLELGFALRNVACLALGAGIEVRLFANRWSAQTKDGRESLIEPWPVVPELAASVRFGAL